MHGLRPGTNAAAQTHRPYTPSKLSTEVYPQNLAADKPEDTNTKARIALDAARISGEWDFSALDDSTLGFEKTPGPTTMFMKSVAMLRDNQNRRRAVSNRNALLHIQLCKSSGTAEAAKFLLQSFEWE
ncbi:Hypothetical predicted protein [Lecanosticta acicola]|uniref:Uncharacterized protein n=1 Tax=Lecanosticta acicola TaxID=111012 RepID=A0AAI8YYI7_9PEZI|nr:Hypothetical predicted protein [Lecanosticta acicola]